MSEHKSAEEPVDVITAFMVVVDRSGIPVVFVDEPPAFTPDRTATQFDVRRALLELSADLAAQASASYVLAGINQAAESSADRIAEALRERQSARQAE